MQNMIVLEMVEKLQSQLDAMGEEDTPEKT